MIHNALLLSVKGKPLKGGGSKEKKRGSGETGPVEYKTSQGEGVRSTIYLEHLSSLSKPRNHRVRKRRKNWLGGGGGQPQTSQKRRKGNNRRRMVLEDTNLLQHISLGGSGDD